MCISMIWIYCISAIVLKYCISSNIRSMFTLCINPSGLQGVLLYPFINFCVLLSDGTLDLTALERSGGSSWQAGATVGPGDGYFRRQHGGTLSPDWALAICSTPCWLCPHSYVLWKGLRCTEWPFFLNYCCCSL